MTLPEIEQSDQNNLLPRVKDLEITRIRKPKVWEEYDNLEVLGEGSYGRIYKVREAQGEKRVVVIKQIDTK